MTSRVHSCPRCSAPLEPGATGRVVCKFCGSDVDVTALDGLRHYLPKAPPADQAAPPMTPEDLPERSAPRSEPEPHHHAHGHAHGHAPGHAHHHVSPFRRRLSLVSGPLLAIAAGYLSLQALFAFFRNGNSQNAILISIGMGVVVIALAVSGRTIQAAAAAALCGALFTAKPFVHPVVAKDGYVFGVTSETHLNYIVPGVLLLIAAAIIAMTFTRGKKPWRPRPVRVLLGAAGFAAGVAIGLPSVTGESIEDAITRFKPRFEDMRATWKTIAAKLPPPGAMESDKIKRDLRPQPVGGSKHKTRVNTEIISTEQLLDPDVSSSYDLIVSGDLYLGMVWTGPKNPLSESVLYDRAAGFAQKLEGALAYRYLVVYRGINPRGSGSGSPSSADAMEVYVFDLTTTEIVACFRSAKAGSFQEGRETLARELGRVTGGLFEFD